MSLNISKKGRKIWTGSSCFSERTNKLVNECINELLNCGVPISSKVCYFVFINGIWHLTMSVKYMGFLDVGDSDKLFKDLIRSVASDVGYDLICIIFPNSVSGCPYRDFTVITDEVVLNNFQDFVKGKAKVVAYNTNRTPLSLNNFCFSQGNGEELKELMLECGNAMTMASALNKSGFGWENWKPMKDDYSSMKIEHKDQWGNKQFIEVVL